MSVELRPLGVACNLSCEYCYQQPQRDAGNQNVPYNLEKMKQEAARIGGPVTLFGGEPLLMPFRDLEDVFAWGLEKFGSSSIQTNGALIDNRHIELFRKYKVHVGISIDGPGALNDVRRHGSPEKTRRTTEAIELAIARLCAEYRAPGLIVTLHRGNATADKLPVLCEWMKKLDGLGVRSVRLHLLEVDDESLRGTLTLTAAENIAALLTLAELERELKSVRFDIFRDMRDLLMGRDEKSSCIWRACDPYTTRAVQGIEGNGQASNCGRTNKDGIDFIKAPASGFERYIALYNTPQPDNGCSGCRFFLMCKGQCPGTAVNGDWRNRTENCSEWKHLFRVLERRLIVAGETPITIQPIRRPLEELQVESWKNGGNPTLQSGIARLHKRARAAASPPLPPEPPPRPRVSWVSRQAEELWQPRLERIRVMLEQMTLVCARQNPDLISLRRMPQSAADALVSASVESGLGAAILPESWLPGTVSTRPDNRTGVILAIGNAGLIKRVAAQKSAPIVSGGYNLPECCQTRATVAGSLESRLRDSLSGNEETVQLAETHWAHPLHAHLGLSVLPVLPCQVGCVEWHAEAGRFAALAMLSGYAEEFTWLRNWLAWPASWSELHGVTEVKAPVFKLCVLSGAPLSARRILRNGTGQAEYGGTGLRFPYSRPVRHNAGLVGLAGLKSGAS